MPTLHREVTGVTGETMTLREILAEEGHEHYFPSSRLTGEPLPCTTCGADPDAVAEAEEEAAQALQDALSREPGAVCRHYEGPECDLCTGAA